MIALLAPERDPLAHYQSFLDALAADGFRGEIARDLGLRTVLATDNSIYQRLPQAAVFPGMSRTWSAWRGWRRARNTARWCSLLVAAAPAPTASR